MKIRAKRRDLQHEPTPEDDDDWVEYGGQLIWAAGSTEGGAPYGISEEEFRLASERSDPQAGWVRAKRILEVVFSEAPRATVRAGIGYVRKMGDGLSREVFAAEVRIPMGGAKHDDVEIAVLLPRRDCDRLIDERVRKEARILDALRTMGLPFRIPRVFGVCLDAGRLVLVRSFERGVELDLRAGRQNRVRPWERVANIAAAIHGIASGARRARCRHRLGVRAVRRSSLRPCHRYAWSAPAVSDRWRHGTLAGSVRACRWP